MAVITLSWSNWSIDRANEVTIKKEHTHDINGFLMRSSLSTSFAVSITHALEARAFVLQSNVRNLSDQRGIIYLPICCTDCKRCN